MWYKILQVFLLYIIVWSSPLNAQEYYNRRPDFLKANSVWAFGEKTGLNFNGATPQSISTQVSVKEGTASVADPVTGELLFYTDGLKCWNRNHQVMPNGNGLMGSTAGSTTQGALIVPVIDAPGKYYLFTLDHQGGGRGLQYSIVDMSLDNGVGDVVAGSKNIRLYSGKLSEAMIAIPGENCDIWLLAHVQMHPRFVAFHITKEGVNPLPVMSEAGNPGMAMPVSNFFYGLINMTTWFIGGMAVSPDRSRIVMANTNWEICVLGPIAPQYQGYLLCRFDPNTGIVSDPVEVGQQQMVGYMAAFSPDNSKLYMSAFDHTIPGFAVYQFDITTHDSAAIAASQINVAPNAVISFSQYLRLYRDTIYLCTKDDVFLSTINQPNLSGTACDYQAISITLSDSSGYALPTEVVYSLRDTIYNLVVDSMVCTVNNSPFKPFSLQAEAGFYAYEWDNGETAQVREIITPGIYWVLCKGGCHSRVDTFVIRHTDIAFSLGPDTALCDQSSFMLKASVPNAAYQWQDGSTDSIYTATGDGLFSVVVSKEGCSHSDTVRVSVKSFIQDLGQDIVFCKGRIQVTLKANVPEGPQTRVKWNTGSTDSSIVVSDTGTFWVDVRDFLCSGSDTIRIGTEICECSPHMPSAFSPNGDGLNDIFLPVIESGCRVNNFSLNIYNRYGQCVFGGTSMERGWDGTYKGIPVGVDTYMYELRFEGGTQAIQYYRKGDLTLIR